MEVIPIYLTAFHRRLEISLDNATRRLPTERTSDNLLQTLSVPATSTLIEYVCDYFRGIESEDWLVAKQHCTYINSDELSCTVVSFWYLANHTPGGKKGERAVGCLSVLGFLASPFRRITIMIVASLYPIHLSWASFSDKAAQIGIKTNCASTRSSQHLLLLQLSVYSFIPRTKISSITNKISESVALCSSLSSATARALSSSSSSTPSTGSYSTAFSVRFLISVQNSISCRSVSRRASHSFVRLFLTTLAPDLSGGQHDLISSYSSGLNRIKTIGQ